MVWNMIHTSFKFNMRITLKKKRDKFREQRQLSKLFCLNLLIYPSLIRRVMLFANWVSPTWWRSMIKCIRIRMMSWCHRNNRMKCGLKSSIFVHERLHVLQHFSYFWACSNMPLFWALCHNGSTRVGMIWWKLATWQMSGRRISVGKEL